MLKRIYNYKDSPLKVKSRARDYVKTFINDSIPYLEVFLPFSIAVISYHTSIILSYLEAEMTEEEVLKNEKVMQELIAQLIRIYLLDNYIAKKQYDPHRVNFQLKENDKVYPQFPYGFYLIKYSSR